MTAAERAVELLDDGGKGRDGLNAARVAALMAHPDLLVDLAIEAGGHCQRTVGYVGEATDD